MGGRRGWRERTTRTLVDDCATSGGVGCSLGFVHLRDDSNVDRGDDDGGEYFRGVLALILLLQPPLWAPTHTPRLSPLAVSVHAVP